MVIPSLTVRGFDNLSDRFGEHRGEMYLPPDTVTRLRLCGRDKTFVIAADEWREIVKIASQMGWQSEYPPACYWADIGLEVAARDARKLSQALVRLGDYLMERPASYLPEELSELIDSLGELVRFLSSGGFRVC